MKKLLIVLGCFLCMAGTSIPAIEGTISDSNVVATSSYIDFIHKFEDNNTFYVELYFSDTYNYEEHDALVLTGEEQIYSDDHVTRTLIPERVRSLFAMDGMSTITIYTKDNVKLTTGKYSHIEYVLDDADEKFVAVFEVENPDIKDYVFCVGNQKKDLTPLKYTEYDDEALKASVVSHLKRAGTVWNAKHYTVDQSIYSAVSIDTAANIVETIGKTHKTIYTNKWAESINKLQIISKIINGKPVLLATCSQPETDRFWTYVLVYNGKKYLMAKHHLITE